MIEFAFSKFTIALAITKIDLRSHDQTNEHIECKPIWFRINAKQAVKLHENIVDAELIRR